MFENALAPCRQEGDSAVRCGGKTEFLECDGGKVCEGGLPEEFAAGHVVKEVWIILRQSFTEVLLGLLKGLVGLQAIGQKTVAATEPVIA